MSNRQQLSIAIITFNEAKRIRNALESVRWADEIVVVDSLSTDQTVAICREYSTQVYQIPWHGHVQQKQIATDYASHDWVLSLDADERVSPELAAEIQQILATPPEYAGYYMPRQTYYLGAWITHCGWYPDYKLRLFQKQQGQWGGENPHDRFDVRGPTGRLHHALHHYTYENMTDHINKMNSYSSIAAAHKTGTVSGGGILLRAVLTFLKKYLLKQGFRDGTRGLIVCLLDAFSVTLKYAKLWERQLEAKPPRSHAKNREEYD